MYVGNAGGLVLLELVLEPDDNVVLALGAVIVIVPVEFPLDVKLSGPPGFDAAPVSVVLVTAVREKGIESIDIVNDDVPGKLALVGVPVVVAVLSELVRMVTVVEGFVKMPVVTVAVAGRPLKCTIRTKVMTSLKLSQQMHAWEDFSKRKRTLA